jgi:hypothetical protein
MPCDNPTYAILSPKVGGKHPRPYTITSHLGYTHLKEVLKRPAFAGCRLILLSCNQCKGCKLSYASSWTTRLEYERQTFPEAMFVTLTYDDEHLPKDNSLAAEDVKLFLRRLRYQCKGVKAVEMPTGKIENPIRYYLVGEYGEQNGRPHYHAIIFNYWFEDAIWQKKNKQGDLFYTSNKLTKIWGKGLCNFSNVTAETCGYTARYIQKKVNGSNAKEHYTKTGQIVDELTGEVLETWTVELMPEFSRMSMRPGIGYFAYKDKSKTLDYAVIETKKGFKKVPTPRYFDKLLEKENPILLQTIKAQRLKNSEQNDERQPEEKTLRRIQVKATVRDHRTKILTREL